MHHFFVEPEQILGDEAQITGSDVNHIRNVLRMQPGEELQVRTGQDSISYRCRIERFEADKVVLQIMWKEEKGTELPSRIVLFQSLPKSDKMELIIQKAVELGAARIVPVSSARCIMKLEGGKAQTRLKRWNAISESAAKQSGRMIIPEVTGVMTFQQALAYAATLDVRLIPYEKAEDISYTRKVLSGIAPGQSVGIFIGPEGGFDPKEIELARQAGAEAVTLGRRILRTETAGMTLIAALMLQLEQG